MTPAPYDFEAAVDARRRAARDQAHAEQGRADASRALAQAEHDYRLALARTILAVHADGAAWTVAQDLARGDKQVARLRYDRDVAKGVLDAAEQASYRHMADRRDLTELIRWSRARDLAENGGGDPQWTREGAAA